MLACTIVYVWPREAVITIPMVTTREPGVFPSPPPIDPNGGVPGMAAIKPDVDPNAVIEPVNNEDLVQDPAVTEPGGGDGEPGDYPSEPTGPISETPITLPDPPAPAADYTWWDEAPVMLSCEPPVYPAIVREAGIDGTVHVRVLVGVNGKVKDARAVDGPAVLCDAALSSARTALFRPALQGVHPVEVWVVIPVTFELRGGR
jgi:protein TonB